MKRQVSKWGWERRGIENQFIDLFLMSLRWFESDRNRRKTARGKRRVPDGRWDFPSAAVTSIFPLLHTCSCAINFYPGLSFSQNIWRSARQPTTTICWRNSLKMCQPTKTSLRFSVIYRMMIQLCRYFVGTLIKCWYIPRFTLSEPSQTTIYYFLVVTKRLYMRVCPSVGW